MKSHFIKEIAIMEDTHWWHRRKREIIADVISKQVYKSKRKLRILEIGAGTSMLIKDFALQAETYALDRNKTALSLSKKNGIAHIIQADLGEYTDFNKNYFDIIVAADVLEHVEDDRSAVKKVYEMLKKGGIFIVHVPAQQALFSYWDSSLGHFRRYEKRQLSLLLKQNKFKIQFLSHRLASIYPLVRLFRIFLGNKRKKGIESDFSHFSFLNTPIYAYTKIEDILIQRKMIKPSFGLSLFAIAKK